jgi:hypothetical protein
LVLLLVLQLGQVAEQRHPWQLVRQVPVAVWCCIPAAWQTPESSCALLGLLALLLPLPPSLLLPWLLLAVQLAYLPGRLLLQSCLLLLLLLLPAPSRLLP